MLDDRHRDAGWGSAHLILALLLTFVLVFSTCHALSATGPRITTAKEALFVELDVPRPDLVPGDDGFVTPRLDGAPARAAAPGAPLLPVRTVRVLLPAGTSVAGVEVLGAPRALPGRFQLAWGQPPVPIGHAPPPPVPADAAIFGSDALYPAEAARVVGEGTFRGYRIATLELRPVQVRPASGEVLVRDTLAVRLDLDPADGAGDGGPRGLVSDLRALAHLVDNPAEAESYGPADFAKDASEPYLIICPEALRDAFQRLLDHRVARGMPGRIETVESIAASYPGVDTPEKMREAIESAYNERGTTYVLLGGDDVDDAGNQLVPYRGCYFKSGSYQYDDAPSDFYFGALDGSWNDDGDSLWCEADEIDYYSEVHVGRATVDTVTEAERFVDKVIAYENGLPEERRRDLSWMGESLDASTWGGDSKDVTAGLIPEDEYELERLYEREGTFSRNAVVDALNRGPHLTNHLGHANSGYVMGIYRSDVDGLTNETPFFSYSQGCDAGAFDQSFSGNSEAISEHFLTADNAGFGVVMNSRYGWYSPGSTNGPSQYFDHEFYDALFVEGLQTLGAANDDSRHDNVGAAQSDSTMRWCFLETNLHGDPATPVAVGYRFEIAAHRVVDDDPVHGNTNGELDTGETLRLAITLENTRSDDAHGVEAFLSSDMPGVTVHDAWASFGDLPAHSTVENAAPHYTFTADLPCGTFAQLALEVRHDEGDPETIRFSVLVGERTPTVLRHDDFESSTGWSVSGTCADGDWERGEPRGTMNGDAPANPDQDTTPDPGELAFVTGNDGLVADDDDVDGGDAVLTSPVLDTSGYLDLRVSYDRWYYLSPHTTPPSNRLRVEVSGDAGESWVELEQVTQTDTPWRHRSFPLESLIPLGGGVQMRLTAGEMEGSQRDVIVEAGLDEVVFEGTWTYCEPFEPDVTNPPGEVGATLTAHRRGEHVRLEWLPPEEAPGEGPPAFYRVERAELGGDTWDTLGDAVDPSWTDCDACADTRSFQYLVTAWNDATP